MFLSRGVNWAHRIGNRGHLMVGASLVGLGFSSRWCRKNHWVWTGKWSSPQKNVHHINGDPHFHRLFFPKSLHQEFTPPHHQKGGEPFRTDTCPALRWGSNRWRKTPANGKVDWFFLTWDKTSFNHGWKMMEHQFFIWNRPIDTQPFELEVLGARHIHEPNLCFTKEDQTKLNRYKPKPTPHQTVVSGSPNRWDRWCIYIYIYNHQKLAGKTPFL